MQGRVPLFFSSTAGRRVLPRCTAVPSAHMCSQFVYSSLLRITTTALPLSRAMSAPVSVCFLLFYKYKSSTFFAVQLSPLNANRFVCFFAVHSCMRSVHSSLTLPWRHTLLMLSAAPFCSTGAHSMPEHVRCQWWNTFTFISGIMLDG